MNRIEEIKAKLRNYPELHIKSDKKSIQVLPNSADGFSVEFAINPGGGYLVSFEGWHENFEDETEALNAFAFGLSNKCRLKEYRRGRFAYKWTVEFFEKGQWIEESTTGLFLFPFWKKPTVRYLHNSLILE